MNKYSNRCAALAVLTGALGACSSPAGPVAPNTTESPQTSVTVTGDLVNFVAVPNIPGSQNFGYTPDGLLQYQFQLQNKVNESYFVRYTPEFFNDHDVSIERQLPIRKAMGPEEIVTIRVTSSSKDARRVRVQIAPAR
ncbi:MAG TPA: hypothetical protein VFD71_04820 [Planctomycetota bacterium]|jgi:hypothetical protein|nr:hypothetical protein [Planctomycetota bacterium]